MRFERRFRPDAWAAARIRAWTQSSGGSRLTICIPTTDRLDLLVRCLDSLASTDAGARVDVVIGDTGSNQETIDFCSATLAVPIVHVSPPFSFSRACNQMAEAATGDRLVFLNNDTEAVTADWAERLLATPAGEVVGAALVYPRTHRLQHAGVTVVQRAGWRRNAYGPSLRHRGGSTLALENIGIGKRIESVAPEPVTVMAVTGAFLSTTRSDFMSLGCFDEGFRTDLQDIDYCLRAHARGIDVRCHREIVFAHRHAASRGRYRFPMDDWRMFVDRWGEELERWESMGVLRRPSNRRLPT